MHVPRPAALLSPNLQPMRTASEQYDRGRSQGGTAGEDPVEVGRYFEALRRSRLLMLAIVALVTGAVAAISLALPKNYESTANIVINNTVAVAGSTETVQRELATIATLATTMPVLQEAAKAVPGETSAALEKHVSSSVDQNANIIHINVSSRSAKHAAALAFAIAQAFLSQRTTAQRAGATAALAALDREIESLRASGATSPTAAAQLSALQTRAGQLESARASSGSQLQLVQPPTVPGSATSPRPFRNAVIALFAALFLAVLVALGREQLTPRVTNQRELGHLLDLPVMSGIPYAGRRINARYARAEHETYQTLSATVQLTLPVGEKPHVILVTSAGHGEGKTTVAARLGRMLAQAGHDTLVISGDLRAPRLDDAFDVAGRGGVRDLLAEADDGEVPSERLERMIVAVNGASGRAHGVLHVLPAGSPASDAAALLQTAALESLIEAARGGDYAYVLVDSPPILGIADTQMLAQFCEEMLVVARLDRLTMDKVIDLREVLYRVNAHPIGLVVIGTRLAESPYYAADEHALAPS